MASVKQKIPSTLYRTYQVRKESINKEARTVEMSFSSEHPVRRADTPGSIYNEILDHNPNSVLMDRLNSGAPFLLHHDPTRQIGRVVPGSAKIDGKNGRAIIRFSKSPEAEHIFQDYIDEIRGNVSVGYQVHAMDQDDENPEDDDGVENLRCTRWEPLEISDESLPADPTVGAGRNKQETMTEITVNRKKEKNMIQTRNLSPTATAGGGTALTPEEIQMRTQEAVKADRLRVSTLLELGTRYKCADDARTFVAEGKTAEEFQCYILQKRTNATPIHGNAITDTEIGMNEKEKNQYSILRAIRQFATGGKLEGLEKEAHEAAVKRSGRSLDAGLRFVIPEDVIRSKFRGAGWERGTVTRDMQAGVFSQGGAFIETEVLGSALIELLRNKMQLVNAGARTMAGLQGNCAIPRQTSGATAYWLGEIDTITESDQGLNQLLLSPHRLAAKTNYSNLLLAQATLDAEAFVRMDLMKQLAIAKDLAGINGSGGAQPVGILNTTGIGVQTVTAGTPTWAQMVGFETTVAAANADFGSLCYITSTASRGLLKTTAKIGTTFPIFIWENGTKEGEGTVNGYRALATNQLNTALNGDKMIFGNYEDLIFADWEGWEVLVDPYTLSDKGEVRITIFNFTDIGVRHAGSFCASNGSVI